MSTSITQSDALSEYLEAAIHVVAPKVNPGLWAALLDPFMHSYGIVYPNRIAAFLGQVAVESEGFTKLEEDLHYRPATACRVWPNHFADESVVTRLCGSPPNPQMIANIVYANRMGNGDTSSGDGWLRRGAGLIELTGTENQTEFATAVKRDPATIGDYLRTPAGAAESACWFWDKENLNPLADLWYITRISEKVNGGDEALEERIALSNAARKVFGV